MTICLYLYVYFLYLVICQHHEIHPSHPYLQFKCGAKAQTDVCHSVICLVWFVSVSVTSICLRFRGHWSCALSSFSHLTLHARKSIQLFLLHRLQSRPRPHTHFCPDNECLAVENFDLFWTLFLQDHVSILTSFIECT